MERIIAREGDDQPDYWYTMSPGAMQFDETAEYDVLWGFKYDKIGKATNVRRDDEGHIVADIEIFDNPIKADLESDMVGYYALSNNVVMTPPGIEPIEETVKRIIESTTLQAVGAVLEPVIPKVGP